LSLFKPTIFCISWGDVREMESCDWMV